MSKDDEFNLELELPPRREPERRFEPEPEPTPQAEPAPEPAAAPAPAPTQRKETPVLKRTPARKRVKRPTRAAHAAPEPAKGGKAASIFRWVVAPRFYYALSFLLGGYAIYAMYNPSWGAVAQAWPHRLLGLDGRGFFWDRPTVELLAMVVLALALLVATCMQAGRARGVLVIAASCLAAAALPIGDVGGLLFVLAGLALVGGALLVKAGTPRATTLVLGLAVLGAYLFLPWAPDTFTRGIDIAPSYQATAFDTIDTFAAPNESVVADKGWLWIIGDNLRPSVALLLAGVGLLALLGAGGRWARWTAGALLLLLCLGTVAHVYMDGAEGSDTPYRAGVSLAALAWFGLAAGYVPALAAAVRDLLASRSRA